MFLFSNACLCLTQESENANFSGFPTKPKAGRRRWGHTTGGLKDDWDDYEDIETTITLLGKTGHSSEKRRQAEGASSRSFSPLALYHLLLLFLFEAIFLLAYLLTN